MQKEIKYTGLDDVFISIHLEGDIVWFEIGDCASSNATGLDKDSLKDLITSLTDIFIQIKDK